MTTVSAPRDLQALAFSGPKALELWLGNLTDRALAVSLEGMDTGGSQLCVLDEQSFEVCAADADGFVRSQRPAAGRTLTLAPYAVARLLA